MNDDDEKNGKLYFVMQITYVMIAFAHTFSSCPYIFYGTDRIFFVLKIAHFNHNFMKHNLSSQFMEVICFIVKRNLAPALRLTKSQAGACKSIRLKSVRLECAFTFNSIIIQIWIQRVLQSKILKRYKRKQVPIIHSFNVHLAEIIKGIDKKWKKRRGRKNHCTEDHCIKRMKEKRGIKWHAPPARSTSSAFIIITSSAEQVTTKRTRDKKQQHIQEKKEKKN